MWFSDLFLILSGIHEQTTRQQEGLWTEPKNQQLRQQILQGVKLSQQRINDVKTAKRSPNYETHTRTEEVKKTPEYLNTNLNRFSIKPKNSSVRKLAFLQKLVEKRNMSGLTLKQYLQSFWELWSFFFFTEQWASLLHQQCLRSITFTRIWNPTSCSVVVR